MTFGKGIEVMFVKRTTKRPHWVLRAKAPEQLPEAKEFWEHLVRADKAVLVYYDDVGAKRTVVGFLRYAGEAGGLSELGTWVRPEWRGAGVASFLWEKLMSRENPVEMNATVVSQEGKKFLASLKKAFPGVHWRVKDKTIPERVRKPRRPRKPSPTIRDLVIAARERARKEASA